MPMLLSSKTKHILWALKVSFSLANALPKRSLMPSNHIPLLSPSSLSSSSSTCPQLVLEDRTTNCPQSPLLSSMHLLP
ncbi:hypothetical protein F5878DRAFT_617642 [Lentinula raphanica]|uniref:Uncharacterized protein n=1 Tax=Lentinula raphanica TaxID=153919 RepID=A0AA38UF88_9AGAR|nr:hypothetical protein F5878DRAFT_617642 [Lentinula raphanica]